MAVAVLEQVERKPRAPAKSVAPSSSPARAAATLHCVGVSHQTAPMHLRERLALAHPDVASILSRFGCGDDARPDAISELVILSTCNRLELYASGGDDAPEALIALIEEQSKVPASELEPVVYRLAGEEAVRHLCRTAAGLESMVIGEPQILGQISEAFAVAVAQRAAGHSLSTLFRGAIRAGRRARVETGINHNPASISSIAIKLVSEAVPDIPSANIIVLGAGEMAELALAAFQHRSAKHICVVSRTIEHAKRLADRFNGRVAALEHLQSELFNADVLVTSTSAPHHIVSRESVELVMALRSERPLAIIDIAVPRDVEPTVRSIPGVHYWDLDDLQHDVERTLAERAAEVPKVERVVDEEFARCLEELRQLDVQPLIADLRERAEAIRRASLERALHALGHVSVEQREAMEALSESLVNKLLHEPMVRLRADAKHGQAAGYAMAVRHLFGLES